MLIPLLGKPQFSHAAAGSTRGQTTDQLTVSETFSSRQGEGKLTGVESFFIRTSGCNLRCWFCDTPYASWNPGGEPKTIAELVSAARSTGFQHVVLTGGEPLLPAAALQLSTELMDAGFHLTIETAGTIDKPIGCDLLSLSPKLASSAPDSAQHPRWNQLHEQRRMPLEIMQRLIAAAQSTQIKFVVDAPDQFDEIRTVVQSLSAATADVFIMPQGTTNQAMDAAQGWLKPLAESAGYQYCDRMQIRWFGNRRGT